MYLEVDASEYLLSGNDTTAFTIQELEGFL